MKLVAICSFEDTVGTIPAGAEFEAEDTRAGQLVALRKAVKAGTRLVWPDLQWLGASVVVIGSGPSLTEEDCAAVRAWRQESPALRKVIAVNLSYLKAPWADILYACDSRWWEKFHARALTGFAGQLWTQDEYASRQFHLNYVKSETGQGLNRKPGTINQGENSGFQALCLAYLGGAARAILLGFDMRDSKRNELHWHTDYPHPLHSFPNYEVWIQHMERLAKDLKGRMEVMNATRRTALTCFPRVPLEEALLT